MPVHGAAGDLSSRLQAALGDAYRIERELGGGGMSRVFLAEEVRLGRKVVVKVLPPEMAAGVNIDRFEREIQLAARLQHPHIVPLLTAGASGDLLYYIMPFIEGESLRAKLAREGELPVGEALRILREVLDALQHAHSHRVVHRDIKPDNVLLSGKHALVTDFGVAKAVSESSGESSLTSLGVALGTPAYMAPEQAAADPHVDHRADIYAVGALAYEMLTGQPPFTGASPQSVLAMHITQAPAPVTAHRAAVPPALNDVVLRCLEKKPADRWQRADEIVPHLEALLTPSGGLTPTATQPVAAGDHAARARQAHPVRIAVLFGLASIGVLAIAYGLVRALGLPDWVFQGVIGLLGAGLPIMLFTAHQERQRARALATGLHYATPVGLTRHATWRKALTGGGLAFAALAVATGLFMLSRALGIGPGATLLSAGVLGDENRLILADFDHTAGDSAMAETVTELFRIDLAQSPAFSLLETGQIRNVLTRMRRDPETVVTPELAAEMAAREGLKAYVAGEVRAVGAGYVLSARVVDAVSGRELVVARETAAGEDQIITAVDRLASGLRARIGESLRSVRADPALDQVTTASLPALRLYTQAIKLSDRGDYDRAIALLEQAVGQDSLFAMAWRRIGAYLTNRGDAGEQARGRDALGRAYALRDRLPERERYHVEAIHAMRVESDPERAITAYLAILEKHPLDATALNNLGSSYSSLGRMEDSRKAYRRAIDARVASSLTYANLIGQLLWTGRLAEADTVYARMVERFPESGELPEWRAQMALARQDFGAADSASRVMTGLIPEQQERGWSMLALTAGLQGRLADADRARREALRIRAQRTGLSDAEVALQVELAAVEQQLAVSPDHPGVADRLDDLWRRSQALTADRPMVRRPHLRFAWAYVLAGQGGQAGQIIDEFSAGLTDRERATMEYRGDIALARGGAALMAGDPQGAIGHFQEGCRVWRASYEYCDRGAFPWMAVAYERGGQADSAVAVLERWAAVRARNSPWDWLSLVPFTRRLGELYEAKGDARKAIEHYSRFVELWQNADASLQPQVREVRDRIARLSRDAG